MKHTLLALALCAALVLGGCGQRDSRPATDTNVTPGVTDHNGSIGTNGKMPKNIDFRQLIMGNSLKKYK